MLRICALNENESDGDSDGDVQVETREAQEAHLLNLYTAALKHISAENITGAKQNLNQIINSPIYQEDKEEALAKSLKYNVHKNLGECLLAEGDIKAAQREMLTAVDIDAGDVTLWFKIAGTAVKLDNLYMCRSALEQGLKCSPNHWPSIDNLMTVTFKLGDSLACLGYCAAALMRDPSSQKAILYKSKVYNEMPFLQDIYQDTKFVPIPTKIETFTAEMKKEAPRAPIMFKLTELTFECLSSSLYALSEQCDRDFTPLNLIDTKDTVSRMLEQQRLVEESKLQVSVQNLVDEIIDIIEEEEEVEAFIDDLLDGILCDMFGVEPKTAAEKISGLIIDEVLDGVFKGERGGKKKSVVLEPKVRERKKATASTNDEIPEDLIEKRRSSRKARTVVETTVANSDSSNDPINIQTPRELIKTFLPPNLKLKELNGEGVTESGGCDKIQATKALFPEPEEQPSTTNKKWFDTEAEADQVKLFLAENSGKTIWHLMRAFLDFMFRMARWLRWPRGLAGWVGKIYLCWRNHLSDPLNSTNPEEKFTQEFLRYYLLGCECVLGSALEEEEDEEEDRLPYDTQQRVEQDLGELESLLPDLPVDVRLRVHSLRFYFWCLVDDQTEVAYESARIMQIYEEIPDMLVLNPVPEYTIVSKKYLDEFALGVSRKNELEELNQYYENKRYGDIVTLLLKTFESTSFTPSKETSRAPNKETQIDILIESLFYVEQYVKCIKYAVPALSSTLSELLLDKETGEKRKPTASDWNIMESYLSTIESCVDNMDGFGDTTFETGSRLATSLVRILSIQIEEVAGVDNLFDATLPWILLHKLIAWAESYMDEGNSDTRKIKGSLDLLCSAHDYLGQKSCCVTSQGRLLNYIIDTFVPLVTSDRRPVYADLLKTNLEQAVYCLFSHPSKKTRQVKHLADHNVTQIALTWDRAILLYRYIQPSHVPEHDDVKVKSISSEADSFMRRLVALIPVKVGISERRTIAQQFVQGKTRKLKVGHLQKLPSYARDVFYLLGDYAFKNSTDLGKAIDYYAMDLTFNPKRYDTWAALALSQASKMDKRLNSCLKFNPIKMLSYIGAVETCFKRCLDMNDGNSNLWIEFGNFSYNMHSYVSRTLKNNSEDINIELFEKLEQKKEELMTSALRNYEKTLSIFEKDGISDDDIDERWLIHYMIGKIKEKTSGSLVTSLQSYVTSTQCLQNIGAVLPKKVNYNSPQPLSLETLEIYYRIHASVLKYLARYETNEAGVDAATRRGLYDVMRTVQLSKVYNTNAQENKSSRFTNKRKRNVSGEPGAEKLPRLDESSTSIMRDVVEVMDALLEEVDTSLDESKYELSRLIKLALNGLEDVAFHFFHHFKALYRLASYYHNSSKNKNLYKVQKLLLAGASERNVLCPGLFFGRKPNQIFNDVWRIPISEIDRPGSFAFHCSKSLMLLIDVLRSIPDLNTLADIAIQMRKAPTEENKFVNECDRVEVGTMSITYLVNIIKGIKSKVDTEAKTLTGILDIYKVYQKLQKTWPGKDKEVLGYLKEMYGRFKGKGEKEKITNEEVTRFCNTELNKGKPGGRPTITTNFATRPVVTAQPKQTVITPVQTSQVSVAEILKQSGAIMAHLERIKNYQEMAAMGIPNITPSDMAACCNLVYADEPKNVNKLFQNLLKMNLQQLNMIKFDIRKLDLIAAYATKLGIVPSSVNNYKSKLHSILTGSSTLPKPVKPVLAEAKPVPKIKQPQFKPTKMTAGQQNLKNLQMLLYSQKQSSIASTAKTLTAAGANVTIGTGFQTVNSGGNSGTPFRGRGQVAVSRGGNPSPRGQVTATRGVNPSLRGANPSLRGQGTSTRGGNPSLRGAAGSAQAVRVSQRGRGGGGRAGLSVRGAVSKRGPRGSGAAGLARGGLGSRGGGTQMAARGGITTTSPMTTGATIKKLPVGTTMVKSTTTGSSSAPKQTSTNKNPLATFKAQVQKSLGGKAAAPKPKNNVRTFTIALLHSEIFI